jgi:hypothetical protein
VYYRHHGRYPANVAPHINRTPLTPDDIIMPRPTRLGKTAQSVQRALAAMVLLCCTDAAHAADAACPAQVRLSFPNFEFAPYVLGTDRVETPPGRLVEWTRNALALAGCKPAVIFRRRPANRQLVELQLGLLDILPGFAYADELTDRLVFPMCGASADPALVVISDEASLYIRADDDRVKWDGKTLEAGNPIVGVSTGGPGLDRIGNSYGWQLEVAATPADNLRKLIARRLDVIMEPNMLLGPSLGGSEGKAVRKLSPPALVTSRYAPVSKRFAAAYPEFTQRFWLELRKQARAATSAQRDCRQ